LLVRINELLRWLRGRWRDRCPLFGRPVPDLQAALLIGWRSRRRRCGNLSAGCPGLHGNGLGPIPVNGGVGQTYYQRRKIKASPLEAEIF
jgi:hypothetical protein